MLLSGDGSHSRTTKDPARATLMLTHPHAAECLVVDPDRQRKAVLATKEHGGVVRGLWASQPRCVRVEHSAPALS